MNLFIPKGDYVGTWHFYNNEILVPYTSPLFASSYYPGYYEDLFTLLTILFDHKMLIPKFIGRGMEEPIAIVSTNVADIVEEIKQYGFLGGLSLYGDTIIFTNEGEKVYHRIFVLDEMRSHQKNIMLSTKSDIWLPIALDFDDYWYHWNLEHYKLNHHRLECVLNDIRTALNWEEDSSTYIDQERACLQLGYKIFVVESLIKREYEEQPNSDFDLEAYLAEMQAQKDKLNFLNT